MSELILKIGSASSLRNLGQGLALLNERLKQNKSRINPGTEGSDNLNLYYQDKLNEVERDLININKLIDKNYKAPSHFCMKNEAGQDTICSQQCQNCSENVL